MSKDNWEYRSYGMKCRTCMWYAPKVQREGDEGKCNDPEIGRCRRRAPTMGGYPVVYPGDWCGDHKLNENA